MANERITKVEFEEEETELPAKPQKVRRSSFLTTYSNQASVIAGPFDIRIAFSEILNNEAGKIYIEEIVTVAMSPHHAKALLYLLAKNLKNWEERFGSLQMTHIGTEHPAEPSDATGRARAGDDATPEEG